MYISKTCFKWRSFSLFNILILSVMQVKICLFWVPAFGNEMAMQEDMWGAPSASDSWEWPGALSLSTHNGGRGASLLSSPLSMSTRAQHLLRLAQQPNAGHGYRAPEWMRLLHVSVAKTVPCSTEFLIPIL
jgi:hypothetical protein